MAALVDQLHGRGLDFELEQIFYKHAEPRGAGLTPEQFRGALVDRFGEAGVKSLEDQG